MHLMINLKLQVVTVVTKGNGPTRLYLTFFSPEFEASFIKCGAKGTCRQHKTNSTNSRLPGESPTEKSRYRYLIDQQRYEY
jgi:hypothetical protein